MLHLSILPGATCGLVRLEQWTCQSWPELGSEMAFDGPSCVRPTPREGQQQSPGQEEWRWEEVQELSHLAFLARPLRAPPPPPATQGGHPCKSSRFSFNRKLVSSALHVLQSDLHGGEEEPGGNNPLNVETGRGPLGLWASAVTKQEVSVVNPPLADCEDRGLTGLEWGSPQSSWLSERLNSDPGWGPACRKYLE